MYDGIYLFCRYLTVKNFIKITVFYSEVRKSINKGSGTITIPDYYSYVRWRRQFCPRIRHVVRVPEQSGNKFCSGRQYYLRQANELAKRRAYTSLMDAKPFCGVEAKVYSIRRKVKRGKDSSEIKRN